MRTTPHLLLLALALAAVAPAAASLLRVGNGTYTNPVIPVEETPDPGVAWDPATRRYYLATTGGSAGSVAFPIHVSDDLVHWKPAGHAFTAATSPKWAKDRFWAPEIHRVNGSWLLFFAAGNVGADRLCIGVGRSKSGSPEGPYEDAIGAPLIDDTVDGFGMIDATYYATDDGTGAHYVVFKRDGNAVGKPTPIHYAPLTPNGLAIADGFDWRATQLITNSLPWEGAVVEAPWVVKRGGMHYLFYSGNGFATAYAVGVARSAQFPPPNGTQMAKFGDPILHTADPAEKFFDPGHCSVVQTPSGGEWVMVYHAYDGNPATTPRHAMADVVTWRGDGKGGYWPAVRDGTPSTTPQPIP